MTLHRFTLASLLAALSLLGVAYLSQYGFGLEPCHLCMVQRYPYMAVIAVSSVMLLLRGRLRWLVFLIPLLFAFDAGIALYHTGVERGIFQGPVSCVGAETSATNIDDLRAMIMQSPVVACNRPAFVFLGLSMAAWNGLAASFLAFVFLVAAVLAFKHCRFMGQPS